MKNLCSPQASRNTTDFKSNLIGPIEFKFKTLQNSAQNKVDVSTNIRTPAGHFEFNDVKSVDNELGKSFNWQLKSPVNEISMDSDSYDSSNENFLSFNKI